MLAPWSASPMAESSLGDKIGEAAHPPAERCDVDAVLGH
jgi:hypothetical protein